ncbi:putative alpha-galactosidase B [Lachnellula hyalina]|uniref:Alpha-galactosidase n=1 Tax=Lachnellula hyalina TaxID=1316788 RepID=A0A8H8TVK1_9HELO|nr:putative alpha-galactosidase B [Lachnellula hyalina]TVY23919.1 putative alpha-galactosidase B [Lachnellula hyalina]
MLVSIALTALAVLPSTNALVRKDGVGKLPALGWNSWNAFNCAVDEDKIMTAANEIVSLGLKDVGYSYVNIDDCWSIKDARDNVTGQIVPDPVKFPSGIKGTADKIHALGLKVGIYSSAGTETCGGYPASIGVEELDAATFASWGIDYLKYDNCYVPSNWTDQYVGCVPDGTNGQVYANGTCSIDNTTAPATYDWSTSNTAKRYRIMRDALLAQNRTILYSLCEWGQADVITWGNATGNSWRVTGDITPDWPRIAQILNENSFQLNYVDFWGHNDPDMLEIGNGDLTLEENRSHFAFWAAAKSPLIIGTALDLLPADLLDILKNEYLLAFSQDATFGKPATPYKWGTNPDWTFNASNPAEYWSGQSENGTLVLALNTLDDTAQREIIWSEVPHLETKHYQRDAFEVTDIWTGEDLGCVPYGLNKSVNSHDTIGFLVGNRC